MGDESRPRVPVKHLNRRPELPAIGCMAVGVLIVLARWLAPLGLWAVVLLSDRWGQSAAGPDTSKGRKALADWFPRANGDAVRNVYYFEPFGWTDHPKYMRFDTNDTTIVQDFIARGGSRGRPLYTDTTFIWNSVGAPPWFHPSWDASALRDSAGFDYLWVSADGHRVWFLFGDH